MIYERTCIDLFTGLGCFSIAARACGVRTIAMCEIKSDCRHFLAANWPDVEIRDNAKTLDGTSYRGCWGVFGGPPCQPSSLAGERRGAADHRWLWPQALRIVDECQPAFVLFENPPGFNGVGLDGVLAHLETQGYETGTLNIPACGIDAPHRRERLWIMGYSHQRGLAAAHRRREEHADKSSPRGNVAYSGSGGLDGQGKSNSDAAERERELADSLQAGALANGLCGELAQRQSEPRDTGQQQPTVAGDPGISLWQPSVWIECGDGKRRRSKPGVCGLVNGPSVGLLEALGNAIVWPIAASLIRAMIQSEDEHSNMPQVRTG